MKKIAIVYYSQTGNTEAMAGVIEDYLKDKADVSVIDPAAFDNIRGQMGIAQLEDLDTLVSLEKGDIEYNKFDKF